MKLTKVMMLKDKHILLFILLLLPLSLVVGLGVLELKAEEPRRAIVAMEMMLRKSYIVPQINGWDYYNKPPLFNWVLVLFFKLTGSCSEWVVRLPGILSFLAIGLINFFTVRKFINKSIAIYSSLFFLTAADIFFFGTMHAGEIDIFYSLIVFLQAISIFKFYERRNFLLLFVTSYFFTALGVLTKGAPSILFQGITLVTYLIIVKREWKIFFSLRHLVGIIVCGIIVSIYFYTYQKENGGLSAFLVNLFKEAAQKSGLEGSIAKTISNIFIFPLNLIKILLPWSLFAIVLIDKGIRKQIISNNYLLFSLIFVVANIPVYWFTDKPANRYIYMFFPFLCSVIAFGIISSGDRLQKLKLITEKVLGFIMVVLLLGSISLFFVSDHLNIPLFYLKRVLLVILFLITVYLFYKTTLNKLYIIALAIVVVRLGMSLFYFSYREQREISYRKITEHLLQQTSHQPILLAGYPYVFESDISIGNFQLERSKLQTAPLIAYQIPYYLTLKTNHIMRFDEQMKAGTYYLHYSHQVDTGKANVIYTFKEGWQPELNLSLVILR